MTDYKQSYLLERAWVDNQVRQNVLVDVEHGRFTRVVSAPDGWARDNGLDPATNASAARLLTGLTLPGFANCHSHAFHRALRGRTQRDRGTFWTWREQMYAVAATLEPNTYFDLARATFREMLAAGYTTVGEFHYLHHRPDGTGYSQPNAMGDAVRAAATEVGMRLCLLDACYVSSGFGVPPEGAQMRFSDGTAAQWWTRANTRSAAIHSVRAVPADQFTWFQSAAILHIHLSEQRSENEQCLAKYGVTPTRLLFDAGLLGPSTTVVHATHLTDEDIEVLGGTGTTVCFTPTTERDLGDGIGPAARLAQAGARLTIGSDSHAVIDPFEEIRGLENDERLASERRGHWTAAELLEIGTAHDTLGVTDAGQIRVGARADLVTVDVASPRTAGTGADENLLFAATAADITQVVADGAVVFSADDRAVIGNELGAAIDAVWS